MASGINLYSSFSSPVDPQANGQERVLEIGKLFWFLKPFSLPFSCPQQAHTALGNPAQPSHAAGHVPFWASHYRSGERFNLPWPEYCLSCSIDMCRLDVHEKG